jgi:hypothetical protein
LVIYRLVEVVLGEPAGLVPDLGGPRAYSAADLMRTYLRANRRHKPILPVRLPVRVGANLAPERAVDKRTWRSSSRSR